MTDIVFNSGMLGSTNSDGGFFRTETVDVAPIKLLLSNGQSSKATIVGYAQDANIGTDAKYDALQLNEGEFGFYSLLDNRAYAIQGLPSDYEKEVLLGFSAPTDGGYTISLNDLESTEDLSVIFLKDNQTGEVVNLREGTYNFTAKAGRNDDRFVLQAFPETVTGLEEDLDQIIYSYTTESELHVIFKSGTFREGTFILYDLNGKIMITETSEIENNRWRADVSRLPVNIYILTVQTEQGIWREKIRIH